MKKNIYSHSRNKKIILYVFLFFLSLVLLLLMLIVLILRQKGHLDLPMREVTPTQISTIFLSPTSTLTPPPTFAPTITLTPMPTITPTPLPPEGEAFSIGNSIEGRSIDLYRFGTGENIRMIIGGIHGGYEWNTSALALKLRDDIKKGVIIIPPHITLYILPISNPDGYYNYPDSTYGRPNARSVDLNRNWDAMWESDWDRTGCFSYVDLTAGEYPFSEPETQALSRFLLDNRVEALISYHSAMSSIFAGGRPNPDPASDDLAETLSLASGYSYPPLDGGLCQYTGQLIDWASAMGIAAVDVELTDHQNNDILINRDLLNAFLAWEP